MTTASASGKAILLGEHAVVYGRPAIAVPLCALRAQVQVEGSDTGTGTQIVAADLGVTMGLDEDSPCDEALALQTTAQNTLRALAVERADVRITIQSAIPIARGLGSGTAVATAIVRALAAHYGRALPPEEVSALVYRTEILLHGRPSGVDNAVVAYERPISFRQGEPIYPLATAKPLELLIADTGVPSKTRAAVEGVRQRWQNQTARYEALFDALGALADGGRAALATGDLDALGEALNEAQRLLSALGVSSAELDALVAAAQGAGALGAKLSGAGQGGCMLALVAATQWEQVAAALKGAGAEGVFHTVVASGDGAIPSAC